ncbi:MAG: sigma-70 family RNA polymerase sigma factor [Planctomycetes bacterium]|jgi:RNA polymerase sigma-70 factor (ECF subfamily)|nr:sigma-70 family RNA polymerase sigma factor [Planctomycetota bacterium]
MAATALLSSDDPAAVDLVVRRIQAGEREAFRLVFLAFERPIRCYLSAHATSAELVDEVLQATFVAAYEAIRTYEPRGSFAAWLRGVARIRLLKELRARARLNHLDGDALEATLAAAAAERLAKTGERQPPELDRCLQQLTPRVRDLLQRRYVDQTPVKVLAVELAHTETWVSVTLHRARATLRECLQRLGISQAESIP